MKRKKRPIALFLIKKIQHKAALKDRTDKKMPVLFSL